MYHLSKNVIIKCYHACKQVVLLDCRSITLLMIWAPHLYITTAVASQPTVKESLCDLWVEIVLTISDH